MNEDLGVCGGQGRSEGEIADLAWFWMMFAGALLVAAVMLFGGVGCSASSRPRATEWEEGDDRADDPRKPNWEKLRQQIGGL